MFWKLTNRCTLFSHLQRLEDFKNLQEELARLKALIDPLVKGSPKVFVKPVKPEGGRLNKAQVEADAPEINKWSLYTVYRYESQSEPFCTTLILGPATKGSGLVLRYACAFDRPCYSPPHSLNSTRHCW